MFTLRLKYNVWLIGFTHAWLTQWHQSCWSLGSRKPSNLHSHGCKNPNTCLLDYKERHDGSQPVNNTADRHPSTSWDNPLNAVGTQLPDTNSPSKSSVTLVSPRAEPSGTLPRRTVTLHYRQEEGRARQEVAGKTRLSEFLSVARMLLTPIPPDPWHHRVTVQNDNVTGWCQNLEGDVRESCHTCQRQSGSNQKAPVSCARYLLSNSIYQEQFKSVKACH